MVLLCQGTANLFSHPRYANGAATNPDAHVFAYAAAQVKKAMEVTQKLGGENFVVSGGMDAALRWRWGATINGPSTGSSFFSCSP